MVTVVLNGERLIEKTIQSVINQSYENLQYIIVDGASTDGTLEIVDRYKNHIDIIVSEPDEGIYDAMNKGIDCASGDWINFMNCGDIFFNNNTVADTFARRHTAADILYGNTQFDYGAGYRRLMSAGKPEELWKGMQFYHQSVFMKLAIAKQNKFSRRYHIAADYDLLYKLQLKGRKFHNTGRIISIMSTDGLSYNQRVKAFKECRLAARSHFSNTRVERHFYKRIVRARISSATRRMLPRWAFLFTLYLKDKAFFILKLIRLGIMAQIIPVSISIIKEFMRRLHSDEFQLGLYADIDRNREVIQPRIAVTLRLLEKADIPKIFEFRSINYKSADIRYLLQCLQLALAGLASCYVGITADEQPCCLCWLLSPVDNENLKLYFRGGLPVLESNEVICEFVFVHPEYRGKRLMGWITTSLWQLASKKGFTRAIAFINSDNKSSLEISEKIGWKPNASKLIKWRMYKRQITFNKTDR